MGITLGCCGPCEYFHGVDDPKMMIRMLPARDHKKLIGCALGVGASVLYLRRAARPVGTVGKFIGTNS